MDPSPPSGPTSHITSQSSIKDETIHSSSSDDGLSISVSDSTHESTSPSMSLTQSPPVQVMDRTDDLDSSSRFSSPLSEWSSSSTSSESLFSIRLTSSFQHDQARLSAADAVERLSQSDLGSLRAESLNILDGDMSDLLEAQKVVRWKTQVERPLDEGVKPQGPQLDSSPLADHNSSELKNRFCWSICYCASCNLPKWMSCSNCKPKKKCSSQSKEADAPASAAPNTPDQKLGLIKRCCFACSVPLSWSWSCSCDCCSGDISIS